MKRAITFFFFVLLLQSAKAQVNLDAQTSGSLGFARTMPATLYHTFTNGHQVIEVDYVGAWSEMIDVMDQIYPRGLSASVDHPKPVSNEYFVRDSTGKVIKAYSTRKSLEELNVAFAQIPLSILTHDATVGASYFMVCNESGGFDSVSFGGSWEKEGLSYGVINMEGELIIPIEYELVYITKSGFHLKKENKWAMMDAQQQLICPFSFERINTYSLKGEVDDEINYFIIDSKYCGFYIASIGKYIEVDAYDLIIADHSDKGYLIVHKSQKAGLIKLNGEEVLPFIYDQMQFTNNDKCSSPCCVQVTIDHVVEVIGLE